MAAKEMDPILGRICKAVYSEVVRATDLHGEMRTPHEAYGVLCEEVAEFFDEVRKKKVDNIAMRTELIQIAAVAVRAVYDLIY